MQAILANRQARPRIHRCESLRHCARQLLAVSGELLGLASLTVALAAGLMMLAGLVDPGIGV